MTRTHAVWNEFEIDVDRKYPDVTCTHCGAKLLNVNPAETRSTICPSALICRSLTEFSGVDLGSRKRQRRKRPSAHTQSPVATQDSVVTEDSQLLTQPILPFHFVDNLSVERKGHYQALVASGFYAAGLSFSSFEMPRFRKALTILQPEMERYQPSRVILVGRLLAADYEPELDEVVTRLRDDQTIVAKEKVVNYIVVSPVTRSVLWCAKTVGENEQTAEYVAAPIGEAINNISNTIGKPVVVSVTTDNAPVMQRVWQILETERSVCCNGCSSDALILILEEVLKLSWSSGVLAKAVKLAEVF
ncbi:hypothetical protein PC129_g13465 [Phytophthora cactorum]|uniref:Uncharacterized protein n=1 Tax=Phytophthora cactorum TaxID=29920 RepID=A0A329T1J3_9STRA|nr:hypothetical protein Pcac1_g23794 [Phytophthora cactorum]KAG2832386.1 hypothetical protein PC111_g6634 [Phytophthora cactorum]KAG2848495.1 hypothetical protein PC112_g664 [Phytophthora cactorum]KAG2868666.1 hypothetical protein PC113_g852 [Phytophthora cactorum]KAG2921634.1 hypothetical protein PC117_g16165 [Phytophthora cactorum]